MKLKSFFTNQMTCFALFVLIVRQRQVMKNMNVVLEKYKLDYFTIPRLYYIFSLYFIHVIIYLIMVFYIFFYLDHFGCPYKKI